MMRNVANGAVPEEGMVGDREGFCDGDVVDGGVPAEGKRSDRTFCARELAGSIAESQFVRRRPFHMRLHNSTRVTQT